MSKQQKITETQTITNLSDSLAIKNFIMVGNTSLAKELSFLTPFFFNGFIFNICVKGSASVKVDHKTFYQTEGSIMTIPPNRILRIENISDDYLVETLIISVDYILDLKLPKNYDFLLQIRSKPQISIDKKEQLDILELHALIVKHYQQKEKKYREEKIKALLSALILEIISNYTKDIEQFISVKKSHKEELTRKFFKLLMTYYKEERSVAFYAEKLCLTPKYLSTMIKSVSGQNISEWINQMVIFEAKSLLKTNTSTVLEISEELNFPNPSFFIHYFKQHVGVTPLKFRNSDDG